MKYARILLTLWLAVTAVQAAEQRAVSRWGRSCLTLTQASWAEAPLVNGQPDFTHVLVHGLVIDKKCGSIQVTR